MSRRAAACPRSCGWSHALPLAGAAADRRTGQGPGGSLRWFAENDTAKIDAYFGSRAAWEALPRDWDAMPLAQPSREPILLDHGYDESKSADQWRADDLRQAAAFRGGHCHATGEVAPDRAVEWDCAAGHRFTMTPNLYLRGAIGAPPA